MLPAKIQIGNVHFTPLGFDAIMEIMRDDIDRRQCKRFAAVTNIHVMVLVERDPDLGRIINDADVCLCDSVSIVRLGRRAGKSIPRCYGPDYMIRACSYGVEHGWRHFLVGGEEGVAVALAARLEAQSPGLQIAGTFCPPFREMTPGEIDGMIETMNAAKPDIVWVGLGAGKQDRWIAAYKDRIDATWFSGVGAAFDFISGKTKRAPVVWRELGLEWLYRFTFEPRRLALRNLEGMALLSKFYLRSLAHRQVEPVRR